MGFSVKKAVKKVAKTGATVSGGVFTPAGLALTGLASFLGGPDRVSDGGADAAIQKAIAGEHTAYEGSVTANRPYAQLGEKAVEYLGGSVTDPKHFLNTYRSTTGSDAIKGRASRFGLNAAGMEVSDAYRSTMGLTEGRSRFKRAMDLTTGGTALRRQVVTPSMAAATIATSKGLQESALTKAGAKWNQFAGGVKYGLGTAIDSYQALREYSRTNNTTAAPTPTASDITALEHYNPNWY